MNQQPKQFQNKVGCACVRQRDKPSKQVNRVQDCCTGVTVVCV